MNFDPWNLNISLVSIALKVFFISVIILELMLPFLRKVELKFHWKSKLESEARVRTSETISFLGAILVLMAIESTSVDESSVSFLSNLVIDVILILSIVGLLIFPKKYGITSSGVYINGWIIRWETISTFKKDDMKITLGRSGFFTEKKFIPTPGDEEQDNLSKFICELEKGIQKNH